VLRQYYNYEVGQCSSGHLFYLGLLGLEGGYWVAYLFCGFLSAVQNLRLFGRDGYVCFEFPTLPRGFLWQVLLASLCCEH